MRRAHIVTGGRDGRPAAGLAGMRGPRGQPRRRGVLRGPGTAAPAHRAAGSQARVGIRVDRGTLALDRPAIRLGAGALGISIAGLPVLVARRMASHSAGLVLGGRALALGQPG